jgi:hypothetical protein
MLITYTYYHNDSKTPPVDTRSEVRTSQELLENFEGYRRFLTIL